LGGEGRGKMSIKETLQKVEFDLQQGDYGKARDSLHGLISSYPDDLSIRRKLGDVYWKLQYPAMAGRYWYIEENKSPEMVIACKAFESEFSNDPMQMLFAIKFRGDFRLIEKSYTGRVLLDLHDQAKEKHNYYVDFRNEKAAKFFHFRKGSGSRNIIFQIGCLAFLIIVLFLFAVGIYTTVGWIF
jgi:hypothetical protein